MGRKKQPTYRIVVIEGRNPTVGKVIDIVGYYAPYLHEKPLKLDMEKIDHWTGRGALPSEAVKKLLRRFRNEAGGETVAEIRKQVEKAAPKPPKPPPEPEKAEAPVETPPEDATPSEEPVEEKPGPAEEVSAEPAAEEGKSEESTEPEE